jgi:hypothetical protein
MQQREGYTRKEKHRMYIRAGRGSNKNREQQEKGMQKAGQNSDTVP